MKEKIIIIIACLASINFKAQKIYVNYVDGEIYAKLSPTLLNPVIKDDPNNINWKKIAILKNISVKYGITKVSKPFYQASDDKILPFIIKINFSKVKLVERLIRELKSNRGVEYAEKINLNTLDITPNDPTFPAHLTQINAPNAWNIFNGNSNITCAIVDNAVAWNHSDLVANTYTNSIEASGIVGVDDDANGYVDDINGYDVADNDNNAIPSNNAMDHGTHCAGIAGATNNNSIGIASIGWNIKIIPVKCQNNTGTTNGIANGYGGILYAAKAGARVISCSWASTGSASASEQAVIDYAWSKGSILVCAAANDGNSVLHYPAAYNHVYAVASVNSANGKSGFSCFGTWVDISAPGEGLFSTLPANGYGSKSGTSMATPVVAGLAALMLSKTPYMTQTDVLNCISSTAANIYTISGNSAYVSGNQLGAGRIDAFAAMNCAASFSQQPVVSNFYALTKNTCPNTPIQFKDSSLYMPTAWSWTFQAGSPATSTSSNPSVQWSAPGVYSVALQATNSNGGNTMIKTAYITVAGPVNLPLSEGFEAVTFLPANWSSYSDYLFWVRKPGVGGFGASSASAMFDNYNIDISGARHELRTPKYIFTNIATAKLRFDVAYKQYNTIASDTLEVKLSTNCGLTWTSIYSKGGSVLSTSPGNQTSSIFSPTAAQWRKDSIDITSLAAGQNNVMISFVNRGHFGQALYLDNINIVSTAVVSPTANFSIPVSVCTGASITLTNTSIGATSYSWSISGGSPATSTATNPVVSFSTGGVKTITLAAIAGSLTSFYSTTLNVVTTPTLTVNSASICSGNTATLNANGAATYSWNTAATTNSIAVSPLTTAVYTVTGNNGLCSNIKTTTVNVTTTPTLSALNQTVCSGNTATINAVGATTYSWSNGSTSNPLLVSALTNTSYVLTGFNGSCVNTKTVTLSVNPTPTIAASNQTLCTGNSTTLTASGATTYTWNTSATGSSIVVTPTSNTNFTVTGSNGACTGTKTLSVFVTNTVAINISASNSQICQGNSVTINASGANTYTWSTASNSSSIIISPSVSTNYTVNGNSMGCSGSATVAILVNSNPIITGFLTHNADCFGSCTGSIVTLVSGGTPGYNYTYSPGGINTNLCAGIYTVTVTDSKGCAVSSSTQISQPGVLTTSFNIISTSCGLCNASAIAVTNGGTVPYTYTWSNSVNSNSVSAVCAGNYSCTITDSKGCLVTNTLIINNSLPLTISSTYTNSSCANCVDGIINTTLTGGTPPYSYQWSPTNINNATITNLSAGCYTLNASDINNCQISDTICIGFISGLNKYSSLNSEILIYPNPAKDMFWLDVKNNLVDVRIFNNLGQLIQSNTNVIGVYEVNVSELARGVYHIYITNYTDINIREKIIIEQ